MLKRLFILITLLLSSIIVYRIQTLGLPSASQEIRNVLDVHRCSLQEWSGIKKEYNQTLLFFYGSNCPFSSQSIHFVEKIAQQLTIPVLKIDFERNLVISAELSIKGTPSYVYVESFSKQIYHHYHGPRNLKKLLNFIKK